MEATMAVNKPTGDNARKGAVKKRTQLNNPLTETFTKRNKKGGQFMAVKKTAKKFKGVRKEKWLMPDKARDQQDKDQKASKTEPGHMPPQPVTKREDEK
jgi:hypothetical protein